MWLIGVRSSCRMRERSNRPPGAAAPPPLPEPGAGVASLIGFKSVGWGTGALRPSVDRGSSLQQPLDLLQQPGQLDGLGVIIIAAGVLRLLLIPLHRMGGEGDDGDGFRP